MGRLNGYSSRDVIEVAERRGWEFQRRRGSHMVYRRAGIPFNLSVPDHRELAEGMLRDLIKTMGLTPEEFIALVKK